MKILVIDYDYYLYPEELTTIGDFISYANEHYNSFVKFTRFETENCAFPYFIEDDVVEVYINISTIKCFYEAEVTVLTRAEYDVRLAQVVNNKCINCSHYEEDLNGDNLLGHRGQITLDGDCWNFEKKTS